MAYKIEVKQQINDPSGVTIAPGVYILEETGQLIAGVEPVLSVTGIGVRAGMPYWTSLQMRGLAGPLEKVPEPE